MSIKKKKKSPLLFFCIVTSVIHRFDYDRVWFSEIQQLTYKVDSISCFQLFSGKLTTSQPAGHLPPWWDENRFRDWVIDIAPPDRPTLIGVPITGRTHTEMNEQLLEIPLTD
jgi:hypothetical protein